jgi:CPA2 family monovalent cation:H+ antiporter-2
MGLQKQKFAGVVFGMLIVEDLAAILMMVLLSTVAVSNAIAGTELLQSLLRLVFFVVVWFLFGIYLVPTFLKRFRKHLNDETLIIVAIGFCLGMVLFASKVGFSAALGAFIMGSIFAETVRAKQIEHLMEPVKSLFGAVFFVSVGMLINPHIIVEYLGVILVLTMVVLVGRVVFATLGVIASGESLKVAVQSGFSLAQIGEFSFIIASLGMSLNVINEALYPIIVAVSIITTFTTPYFIKLSAPVYGFMERALPLPRWEKLITGYAASGFKTVNKQADWNKLLKTVLVFVFLNAVVCLAIFFVWKDMAMPFILSLVPGVWGKLIAALLALMVMAPFLRTIAMKKNRSKEFKNLWDDNNFNRGALISLVVLRIGISSTLILLVLITIFPSYTVLMVVVSMAVIAGIIYSKGFKRQSQRVEARFLENLNRKQRMAVINPETAKNLMTRNIHVEEIEVSPLSPRIGKTLRELNFRERMGLNIVTIVRGHRRINIPDADERLYPYDRLIIAGADENIQRFMSDVRDYNHARADEEEEQIHVALTQYVVEADSPMLGHTIQELDLQNKTECMIICVRRGEEAMLRITPDLRFLEGDTILLAGEEDKLKSFASRLTEQALTT